MIHVRKVNSRDVSKSWLGEAFMFNSFKNNMEDVEDLQYYPMYIVHKDSKDIGFFLLYPDANLKEISASYWAHPRHCRMNMLPIIQVSTVAAIDWGKEQGMEHVMLRITEGLPCRLIKKMYNGFEVHRLKPGYNLLYGTLNSLKLKVPIVKYDDETKYSYEVDL